MLRICWDRVSAGSVSGATGAGRTSSSTDQPLQGFLARASTALWLAVFFLWPCAPQRAGSAIFFFFFFFFWDGESGSLAEILLVFFFSFFSLSFFSKGRK